MCTSIQSLVLRLFIHVISAIRACTAAEYSDIIHARDSGWFYSIWYGET